MLLTSCNTYKEALPRFHSVDKIGVWDLFCRNPDRFEPRPNLFAMDLICAPATHTSFLADSYGSLGLLHYTPELPSVGRITVKLAKSLGAPIQSMGRDYALITLQHECPKTWDFHRLDPACKLQSPVSTIPLTAGRAGAHEQSAVQV